MPKNLSGNCAYSLGPRTGCRHPTPHLQASQREGLLREVCVAEGERPIIEAEEYSP
jgi:hypothetical protein